MLWRKKREVFWVYFWISFSTCIIYIYKYKQGKFSIQIERSTGSWNNHVVRIRGLTVALLNPFHPPTWCVHLTLYSFGLSTDPSTISLSILFYSFSHKFWKHPPTSVSTVLWVSVIPTLQSGQTLWVLSLSHSVVSEDGWWWMLGSIIKRPLCYT